MRMLVNGNSCLHPQPSNHHSAECLFHHAFMTYMYVGTSEKLSRACLSIYLSYQLPCFGSNLFSAHRLCLLFVEKFHCCWNYSVYNVQNKIIKYYVNMVQAVYLFLYIA